MVKGDKVRPKRRLLIDEDDDGVERFAEPADVGVVELLNENSEGKFINYAIGFPHNGAMGFYDPAEVREHFEILGG